MQEADEILAIVSRIEPPDAASNRPGIDWVTDVLAKAAARGARIRLGILPGGQLCPSTTSALRNISGVELSEDLKLDLPPRWPIALTFRGDLESVAIGWNSAEDYGREGLSPETGSSGLNLLIDATQANSAIQLLRVSMQ